MHRLLKETLIVSSLYFVVRTLNLSHCFSGGTEHGTDKGNKKAKFHREELRGNVEKFILSYGVEHLLWCSLFSWLLTVLNQHAWLSGSSLQTWTIELLNFIISAFYDKQALQ